MHGHLNVKLSTAAVILLIVENNNTQICPFKVTGHPVLYKTHCFWTPTLMWDRSNKLRQRSSPSVP